MNSSEARTNEHSSPGETQGSQLNRTHPSAVRRNAAKALIVASAVLPLANSSPAIDAHKPEGPYSTAADWFDYEEGRDELIPAEPIDALTFSDDFNQVLSSRGYTVYINEPAVTSILQPDQIAVFEQIEAANDEHPVEQRTVVRPKVPSNEDWVPMNYPAYNDEVSLYDESNIFGLSHSGDFEHDTAANGWVPLGNGLSAHTTTPQHPANITFSIYGPDENNEMALVSQLSTEARLNPNVSCEQTEIPVVSEVALSPSQLGRLCQALQQYDALVPSDYHTLLNSVTEPIEKDDSVLWETDSIVLTFPFVGNEEIPADEFRRTILHEFLHATYDSVEIGSSEFHQFNRAYEDIVKVMNYRRPTDAQQNLSDVQVPDVEPAWATITESSYQHEESLVGHPWDNPTEMLSSTAAVLAFYPQQFIERFHALTPSEQAAIRKAVEAVKTLTDTTGTPVTQFIPEYDRVQSAIAES